MTYFLRKAIVNRIERNKINYILWGEEFKTFEEARAQRDEFEHGDCFDILRGDEVLIKHTRAYNTGVYNKIEKSKYHVNANANVDAFKNSEDSEEE